MYVRPSHRVVEMLAELTGDRAYLDCDDDDEQRPAKVEPLVRWSRRRSNLAILTLQSSLFLENRDIIRDIARDCVKIYSRVSVNTERRFYTESASRPYMIGYLEKILDRKQPSKAFLRNTFRQVIGFITCQSRASFGESINYQLSFVNELRVAHSTSTQEDKRLVKLSSEDSIIAVLDSMTKDASLFLYWSCIEAAKYCVSESNISKDISVNDFISILNTELSNTGKFSEKYLRQFFVIFIQSLEKVLSNDLEASLRRSSFISSESSETQSMPCNQMLHKWIVDNRERIADFGLKTNDPAQCWRNIDIRLSDDLALKRKSFTPLGSNFPIERTWSGMNAEHWQKNLSLITGAAIKLGDLDLLYGIESLANSSGLICDFAPLSAMISNLEGNFERTHADLMGKCNELDERSLNEFLKACVEMNLIRDNVANVDLLQSDWLKDSYKKLIWTTDGAQQSLETRLREAKQWVETWSNSNDPLDIDLIMSAYMRAVSKPPQELLPDSHDQAEWLLSQDFIAQALYSPSQINENFKIYNVLFEILKLPNEDKYLPVDSVEIHSKNSRWNSTLFRHICDLNWLDLLRQQDDGIDLVQYRAIKHHYQCKNTLTAMKLSEDLITNGTNDKVRIQCSLLMASEQEIHSNSDRFRDILGQIEQSIMMHSIDKIDLKAKVFRNLLRSSEKRSIPMILSASCKGDNLTLRTCGAMLGLNCDEILNSSSELSKVRTLSLISKICHEKSIRTYQSISSAFKLDLKLLKQLNLFKSAKYNSSALNCAIRLLKRICDHSSNLDQEARDLFCCQEFQEQTLATWIFIKSNIISLLLDNGRLLDISWKEALKGILKLIVRKQPNTMLYSIIFNHMESKFEHDPNQLLDSDKPPGANILDSCDLWQELYEYMTKITGSRPNEWLEVICETEAFVREMRRISHLSGENLYALSSETIGKFNRFLERMRRSIASGGGQFTTDNARINCEARFRSICQHALKQVEVLLLFTRGPNPDGYGTWFKLELEKNLRSLKNLIRPLLSQLAPFTSPERSLADLQVFVAKANDLFSDCQRLISNYSNQLWMHLISPRLSRLEPSEIPMPGCCSDPCSPRKQTITIHKVSQTVEMIASKTGPKRLVLVGSDGVSRSFLLKAHEDLRQDQYIMDLFVIINRLLLGEKETQNICRLRSFSVTPISSKSGLIEWINAPALASIYKSWLSSSSGRLVLDDLYSSTCRIVCGTAEVGAPKSNHANCQVPAEPRMIDIFYQLLWAKAKQANNSCELTEHSPSRESILKYRAEFDASLFQSVLEQLVDLVPSDLIANSLWHRSINSYSYWRKTKQFTRSYATISMVGYIIGLGDRHLGNILLDHDTGEVIHVDFNVCFELGKKLSIPERVPFRLTHNVTRAFGFAGLEGCFTRTSRKVLNLLKDNKSTLVHLLEPANWSFKIMPPNLNATTFEPEVSAADARPKATAAKPADSMVIPDAAQHLVVSSDCPMQEHELEQEQEQEQEHEQEHEQPYNSAELEDDESDDVLKSQLEDSTTKESELDSDDSDDVGYSLMIQQIQLGSVDYDENGKPFLNDLQVNIQTPVKFLEGIAAKMFERIVAKLSGADDELDHIIASKASIRAQPLNRSLTDTTSGQPDVPVRIDRPQSTEDQVDALICEATSLRNKATMFEGWTSWV